ncbi:MAG: Bifunctional oligoribonuclease and PAP phosphatase NrnA [Desulfovibrio sp.]
MTVTKPAAGSPRAVAQCVTQSKRMLAVTHTNPDGDAIGSLVAFSHAVKALGIDVRLYCDSPIPDFLDWVTYPSPPVTALAQLDGWQPDTVVFLDCADEHRAGTEMSAFVAACRQGAGSYDATLVCIDHHMANPLFADVNWVDSSMSATGIMVALLAKELGQPLTGPLGEGVYLAIVSDTGSFSFSNTNALALELAAEIVRNGLSLAEFTNKYENTWTLSRMYLWGALMREVKILCNGKIVVSVVTEAHLREYGAQKADLEGFASWLRRLKGSKVVILARAKRSGSKVSLRSMGDVDMQAIASQFGGGGHAGAAGADMPEPPFEAANMILAATCKAMNEPICSL